MKPHKQHPISRRIDVDISGILLGPDNVRTTQISQETVFERAFSQAKPSGDGNPVGPFGWISVNFVAVCSLIAVFCTIFIRDSFEYSRRSAHLPPDASELRPEFQTSQSFNLEPSRLASAVGLDNRQTILREESALYPTPQREFQAPQDFHPGQPLASLPNNSTGFADRASSTSSSTGISSENSAPSHVSRATSSGPGSSSSATEASFSRSSKGRAIRRAGKSPISRAISSSRQRIQRSMANRAAIHSARPSLNTMRLGNGHGQISAGKAQITGSMMSMHSLGGGAAVRQGQGAMSPMRMESGLLAQPGIGAGLGGVSGNGLGGGGANRGGGRVAK